MDSLQTVETSIDVDSEKPIVKSLVPIKRRGRPPKDFLLTTYPQEIQKREKIQKRKRNQTPEFFSDLIDVIQKKKHRTETEKFLLENFKQLSENGIIKSLDDEFVKSEKKLIKNLQAGLKEALELEFENSGLEADEKEMLDADSQVREKSSSNSLVYTTAGDDKREFSKKSLRLSDLNFESISEWSFIKFAMKGLEHFTKINQKNHNAKTHLQWPFYNVSKVDQFTTTTKTMSDDLAPYVRKCFELA